MSDTTPGTETIALTIPATAEWLALARTTGAAIASRWQFTYDEIADLRLAIDELCLTLIGAAGHAEELSIAYSLESSAIVVRGSVRLNGSVPPEASATAGPSSADAGELSERILDALVDEHGSEEGDSEHRAWLRKQRTVTVA